MTAPADELAAVKTTSPRALIAVIAAGIFVTGFGLPKTVGYLPFSLLLKNQLHMSALQVSEFWAISLFVWYVKPLVGTVLAGLFWLTFTIVPRRYLPFMLVMTVLNVAMVAVSTVIGGLQVEVSQRYGASGRLASLRTGLERS